MYRVIAVLACGVSLAACSSSWMPSFDMPSFGGGGGAGGPASLAVESDPPGAQASAGGVSCVTPCRLTVAANGSFSVNVALTGYVPQSVPVRVVQPDDPRLGSEEYGGAAVRLDPNPVYVELERAPPPAPPPAKKKAKRPQTSSRQVPPPAAAQAPAPSAPTTAVAPAMAPAPAPTQQPMTSTAPWPMPR